MLRVLQQCRHNSAACAVLGKQLPANCTQLHALGAVHATVFEVEHALLSWLPAVGMVLMDGRWSLDMIRRR